jgi:hypothetical protein
MTYNLNTIGADVQGAFVPRSPVALAGAVRRARAFLVAALVR